MKIRAYIYTVLAIAFLASCKNNNENNRSAHAGTTETERNKEAREDSLKMADALALQSKFENTLFADYETTPVNAELGDDAADDPAIWINKIDPANSLIIGTNKKAGLNIYNIRGEELQFAKVGEINNAEVAYDFYHNGRHLDIVAGSNRTSNTVDVYEIKASEFKIEEKALIKIESSVDEVYGLCTYYNKKGNEHYIFVNGKDGQVEQWLLRSEDENVTAELTRTLQMPSQPEGMVCDEISGKLYVGVEEDAIYKFNALPDDNKNGMRLVFSSEENNKDISYDIEGLSIYRTSDSEGYLIASSQGSFSYAVFDINDPHKYLGSFVIKNGKYDGVEETDGLEITNIPLGDEFPKGMLVVQDGFNMDGDSAMAQNFKILSAEKVLEIFNK